MVVMVPVSINIRMMYGKALSISQLDGHGYPKLSGNGQSLDYLFNTDSVDGKTSYTNNGNGLDGLFTFDEEYWVLRIR